MAEVIEDPKKKKASFGDAAAAATDPGITQLNVGRPGDFPVNPDGTPMQKMAAPSFGAGALPPATQTEKPPGFATTTLEPAAGALPPSAPIDPQTLSDRQAVGSVWDGIKSMNLKAGAAIADVATLPLRGVVGAYDSAVVRPMRAAGVNAAYLSPKLVPDGANVDSMTPFYDQIRAREGAPAGAQNPALTGVRMNEITDPRSLLYPGRQDPAQVAATVAPMADPVSTPPAAAPIAAGAVKTQGQMNMEADLKSAEAMKAERLAAESRAPQAVVTHSGNDWQARNNLRNLEVSASSMTAQPKDLMAYEIARKHDTQLQGGSTAADVANVAAVNRNNEINSIAQVANARTAQQGQQFGASHDLATQRLALDNRKADIADAGAQMDNATKKQLQDLNAQILKETDPAKLAVLQEKAQTLTSKYQRPDPAARELYKAITDPVSGKVTMYNTQTGEIGGGQPKAPATGEVRSGHRFKGGDPADQKNWEKV